MESRVRIISSFVSLIILTITGTVGLAYIEHWSLFDAFFVTMISLTTVGLGDVTPVTHLGMIYLMIIILLGVGIVAYSLGSITNSILERQITKIMNRNGTKNKLLQSLKDHIIVCGAGRVGSNVASVLKTENVPYVMVDHDLEVVERNEAEGHLIVQADPSDDDVLIQLGILRASGIICALPNDANNLFITLTARTFSPDLKIVARAERPESMAKLRRAGADKVIAPTIIAGSQMAMAMIKPLTVGLIDSLYYSGNEHYHVEELEITRTSAIIGKDVKTIMANETAVSIIAIIRQGEFLLNIRGDHVIHEGDILVLVGSEKALKDLESF